MHTHTDLKPQDASQELLKTNSGVTKSLQCFVGKCRRPKANLENGAFEQGLGFGALGWIVRSRESVSGFGCVGVLCQSSDFLCRPQARLWVRKLLRDCQGPPNFETLSLKKNFRNPKWKENWVGGWVCGMLRVESLK